MSCEICGVAVTSSRAKYCGSACRQQAYRDRKKQEHYAREATWSMFDMERLYNLSSALGTMRTDDVVALFELARRIDGNASAKRSLNLIADFFGVYEDE